MSAKGMRTRSAAIDPTPTLTLIAALIAETPILQLCVGG